MTAIGFAALFLPVILFLYAYVGYPALLRIISLVRPSPEQEGRDPDPWPRVSITVPAYNEEAQIAETIESLLALDYPEDRRQILIVSDASSDRTDEIVRTYEDQGVELLRMPERGGKTAAENAASEILTGEIVINTDASIRILPQSLKELVRKFEDPRIGLSSGRDISKPAVEERESNVGERGYVGYEMRVRNLETGVAGIVGASGCLYAIRADLHRIPLPKALSRDFAAALNVIERGYRAVSVDDALCIVPRNPSLKKEYRRKVRTMTRGMETLWFKRALLNPFRHGVYAWMLFSHKVCRWLLPVAGLIGFLGLVILALDFEWARWLSGIAILGFLVAVVSWFISDKVHLPTPLRILAFGVMGNVAAIHSLLRALRGDKDATWEPTRRT